MTTPYRKKQLTQQDIHIRKHDSLVPRPSPPPVFHCLQYAKTEGEGLGDLSHARERGEGPNRCNLQTLHLSASKLQNNELYWCCLSNATVSSSWTTNYKKDLKILHQSLPPSVYLYHVALPCTWLNLPSLLPPFFTYCKTGRQEQG